MNHEAIFFPNEIIRPSSKITLLMRIRTIKKHMKD